MKTISIIVPVYNVETYLERCLQSLVMQTYPHLEIICVNDGSTDNSLEILKRFEERDSRFSLINKENCGLSSARNTGLEQASGEYIMFVDSDDWIELDTCEKAVHTMQEYNCDLVMWTYSREFGDVSKKKVIFNGDQFFDEAQCKQLHRRTIGMCGEEWNHPENADALAPAWNKLMKRSIIEENDIRFVDTSIIGPWEDGLFTLYYLESVKKAVYLDSAFYRYRKGVGVTSRYKPTLAAEWNYRQMFLKNYIHVHRLDESYIQALRNRNSWNLFSLASNSMQLPVRKAYHELKNILNNEEFHEDVKTLDLKYLPLHWKVLYVAAKLKCTLFVLLLFLFMKKRNRK